MTSVMYSFCYLLLAGIVRLDRFFKYNLLIVKDVLIQEIKN